MDSTGRTHRRSTAQQHLSKGEKIVHGGDETCRAVGERRFVAPGTRGLVRSCQCRPADSQATLPGRDYWEVARREWPRPSNRLGELSYES